MQTNQQHAGYAATGRTGGGLAQKINEAEHRLNAVPLAKRDEYWAAAVGGVKHAHDLLVEGRRAKAGKVFAAAAGVIASIT